MYFKTDIPYLDIVLSGNGFKLGKIYEIFGVESSAKSTVAQFFVKKFQEKINGKVLYIDTENAFDLRRFAYMGGSLDNFEVFTSVIIEDILEKINEELDNAYINNQPVFIVFDTIASTITRKEKEKGEFSEGITKRPRILSTVFPQLADKIAKTNSALVLVNQVYDLIQGVGGKRSKGGRAIRYFSSVRIEVSRIKDIVKKQGDLEIPEAIFVKLKTIKNKLFYPRLEIPLYIHNEKGVLEIESIIEFLVDNKIVSKAGGWKRFKFGDIDFKFNNADSFIKQSTDIPNFKEILQYIIIKRYINISPLVKVKLIDWLNEIEEKLNIEKTNLSEYESYLAQIEEDKLMEVE